MIAHANWQTIKKDGTVRIKFTSDKESGFVKFRNLIINPKDIREKIKEIDRLTNKLMSYKERALSF